MFIEPMHAARLAMLEGALLALLRAAQEDEHPGDAPDGLTVTLDALGLDLTYTRQGVSVGGEAL